MRWIRTIFLLCFSGLTLGAFSQPYPCDGRLILSAVNSNTTTFNITFAPFRSIFYAPMSSYLGERFDAVGFNPLDNFIYGVKENTNSIVRLHINGTHEVIGSVPQVDTLKSFAGDCSPDGMYLCHDNELDKILVFNVKENFELVRELDLFWSPASQNSGPFKTRLEDFVIDPNDPGTAYTYQGHYMDSDLEPAATRGFLLRINVDLSDPNAGMITPLFEIPNDTILQLESLFFTKEGQLYGIGPHVIAPFVENRIISINPSTASSAIEGLTAPPATQISDGCSCPYSLSFQNDIVPRNFDCSNETVNFVLTLTNNSFQTISGVTLTDTLPEEILIREISNSFTGDIVPGTGVGTGVLIIENLQIPPKETVEIVLTSEVIDIPEWLVYNQAFLTNLPVLFGGSKLSDEPRTPELLGDASGFISTPVVLEDTEITVVPPSECLNANDAQLIVSSPLLSPGQNFSVLLQNENFEEFSYDVVINEQNSFKIDSLFPGEYVLAKVTLENSRCSYSWEEQSILIEAPNVQLITTLNTNSPLCEGDTLTLNGTVFPQGEIQWSGPEGFSAAGSNLAIADAPNSYSGVFEMLATYGFCTKTAPVEILIAPKIEAAIVGPASYCARAPVHLKATGNGSITSFEWSGPDTTTGDGRHLKLSSITPEQAGFFEVILSNGICSDTAAIEIEVLPTPAIEMPRLLETDFCNPQQLTPVISGDNNVQYFWTRNQGLDCYDCPAPELQAPFLPSYQLVVSNDFACADTASVQVVLNKESLIYVPNAFSPNFDGQNDYFQLYPGCGVTRIQNLKVLNRWGAVVFSKDEIDHSNSTEFWDGRIGGQPASPGVYIWQAAIELADGTRLQIAGDVGILR